MEYTSHPALKEEVFIYYKCSTESAAFKKGNTVILHFTVFPLNL